MAVACWHWIVPLTLPRAATWSWDWVAIIVAFNLACEAVFYGLWHHLFYATATAAGPLRQYKYAPDNQYEPGWTKRVGMLTSSTGNLQREIVLTTLGWLQSAAYQCVFTWMWASGRLPYVPTFTGPHLAWNIACVLLMTYFREAHFYCVHRMMHPWWDRRGGLANGDIGAFLYRWAHSW